jgi:hypothetical protein
VGEDVSFTFATLVEKYTQDTGGGGSDFTFGWDLMRYVQLGSATQNACTSGGNGP